MGFDAEAELDRQTTTLLAKGYPEQAGMTAEEFLALVEPLRHEVGARAGQRWHR
jgi:hypothetical protein